MKLNVKKCDKCTLPLMDFEGLYSCINLDCPRVDLLTESFFKRREIQGHKNPLKRLGYNHEKPTNE